MISPIFTALVFFNLCAHSTTKIKLDHTNNSNPIEDIVVIADPVQRGALLVKGLKATFTNEIVFIEVFSLKGKKVKELQFKHVDGSFEFKVDELQEGEYLLHITNGYTKYKSRLIITD
jgi:hypothetical protein